MEGFTSRRRRSWARSDEYALWGRGPTCWGSLSDVDLRK